MIVNLGKKGMARLEKLEALWSTGLISEDTAFWLFMALFDGFTASADPEPVPEPEEETGS